VEGDLVVPLEALPDNLKESMGAAWRLREKNRKVLEEQSNNSHPMPVIWRPTGRVDSLERPRGAGKASVIRPYEPK